MTTLRWQNVPVQQTVQTWVGGANASWKCNVCGENMPHLQSGKNGVCNLCRLPLPLPLLKKAQERLDLMDELRDARADRDRYIARCAELERRLEAIRGVLR